jgi:branched-chain amino acid transport system ATP-binding protein
LPLLETRGLSRNFGTVRALENVDVDVLEGEILGIIGPNGSGKTTFFNCVSGRLKPSAGTVRWRGSEITGKSMHKVARLGLVRTFQESRIFPTGTVRANLEMALAIARIAAPRENAARPAFALDDLVQLAGLADVVDMAASSLPFGYLRRLGIALALAAHPALLMLDEPAAGLNAAEGAQLGDMLRRIHEHEVTLVVVDHDMDFLLSLVERLVVLANGAKLREGPPDAIRSDPAVIEVYLGSVGTRVADLMKVQQTGAETTRG